MRKMADILGKKTEFGINILNIDIAQYNKHCTPSQA